MKVVIDISEEDYKKVKDGRASVAMMRDVIRNGTPLPKGCGDLIDRKELLKQPMDTANYPSNYVRVAHPVIKADTEDI